ncbi:nucleotidyltransferase [Clostridium chromiireducens]|uniref:nucleotidyltransferase n=1 Tax=Clostridium chromiireducens TaxID=225345 RepID=UPI003AF55C95
MYSKSNLEAILEKIVKNLNIPETRYEQAEKSYKSISEWLNRENSSVINTQAQIYPQGSFRLGTVIKPITENDEYDIDLVCNLELSKKTISQRELKIDIGEEIKAYANEHGMIKEPEEGKRCWTLNYADGAQFHVDILPTVPNGNEFKLLLESKGYKNNYSDSSIAITDNTHPNYEKITDDWYCSNPKGYADWFKERMKVQYENEKHILMEKYSASIEQIEEYKVKTPLQKVIQLLKRHRDIMFQEDQDDKPISIIITTLAAHAYNNEHNLVDAYINIVNRMESFITSKENAYWVENPVNPLENFADKWDSNPKRMENFFKWINQVKIDISKSLEEEFIDTVEKYKITYGEKIINESVRELQFKSDSQNSILGNLIINNSLSHRKKPKWQMINYGDISITTYLVKNGFQDYKLKGDEVIEKKCELRFEAKTNIEKPYKIYWQVTNTGKEAEQANCLRGDFYDGILEKGKLVRKEDTLYTGKHLVECFVVKNGACVAKSGEFVVNIK